MFKFDSFGSRSKLILRIMLISVEKVYLCYTAWSWHNIKRTSYSADTEASLISSRDKRIFSSPKHPD